MKVLLVNGGAHPKGCRALEEVEKALKEEEIETLIYHIPNVPLQDCIACGTCAKIGKCVFDDCVNEFVEMAKEADGFIFGTPVYYAHPTGKVQSFMDRIFYSGKAAFVHKPAALGKNMAWMLKCIEAGKKAGIDIPQNTKRNTNFIR